MVDVREDIVAYPVLVDLLACLEHELTARGLSVPGIFAVEPGQLPAFDMSEEGCDQGWVVGNTIAPSLIFPTPDTISTGLSDKLVVTATMGIVRCSEGLDDNGAAPDADMKLADARIQYADMAAMKAAICKCLKAAKRKFVLGTYTSLGPNGLQVGGQWTFQFRYPADS